MSLKKVLCLVLVLAMCGTMALAEGADASLEINVGDTTSDGVHVDVSVSDEGRSEVRVSADGEDYDTSEAVDDQGHLRIDKLEVDAGFVNSKDVGIGVNAFDYSDSDNLDIDVEAGSVSAGGDGIAIYEYGGELMVDTDDVTAGGDGIHIEGEGGDVTVDTGDVNATGNGVYIEDENGEIMVETEAVNAGGDGIHIEDEGGNITVDTDDADLTATSNGIYIEDEGGDITVATGDITAGHDGIYVYEENGTTSIEVGDVTSTDGNGIEIVNDYGEVSVDTCDIEVGNGSGISVMDVEGSTDVSTGDIAVDNGNGLTVMGGGEVSISTGEVNVNGVDGLFLYAMEGAQVDISIDGAVTVDGISDYSRGMFINVEDSTVTVTSGDVTVTGLGGIMAYADSGSVTLDTGSVSATEGAGLNLIADSSATLDVTAAGDVTGGTTGMELCAYDEESEINAVVDGTVSGGDVAIYVNGENTDPINLAMWAAEENADGEIVRMEGGDQEVAALLEQAIQYIVHIADSILDRVTVSTGHTVTVGDAEYATAAEDEEVTVQVSLAGNEYVRGVYYNDEEKTKAEYTQSGDNLLVRMLRGGAMLLGLDIGVKPQPQPSWHGSSGDDDSDEHHHSAKKTSAVSLPPTIQEVASEVEASGLFIDLLHEEVVLSGEDLATFETLGLRDQMLLMPIAMGLPHTDGAYRDSLSPAAKALAARLTVSQSPEIDTVFAPREVVINGQRYESFALELRIGDHIERFIFYDDHGVWRLYRKETI